MDLFQSIGSQLFTLGKEFAGGFVSSVIAVIVIIVFIVIGWIVAALAEKIIKKLFDKIKFKSVLEKTGMPEQLAGFTVSEIILLLVKIFILLAFLGAATELSMVKLGIVTDVIRWAIGYIPMLIQGIIVLVVALLFAHYVSNIIKSSKKVPLSHAIAFVLEIFIGYAALVIAIPLILPSADVSILKTAFEWFIASIAIAFGIGLGIATGFSLKGPIEKAAEKHPGMFDYLLGKVEKSIRNTKRD